MDGTNEDGLMNHLLYSPTGQLGNFYGNFTQVRAGQVSAQSSLFYIRIYGSGLGPFIIWLGPKNFVWVLFFLYISYPYQLNIIIGRPALRSHPVIFRSSKKDGKVRVPKSPLYRVQTQSSPSYGRSHGIAAMQHLWRMCLAKFIFFQKARFTFASGVVD